MRRASLNLAFREFALRYLSLAVLGVLTLAACAPARPREPSPYTTNYRPPRDENFNGGPNAMLLKYDANNDGILTRDELAAGLKAEFDTYDTKHTGCLDADTGGRDQCAAHCGRPSHRHAAAGLEPGWLCRSTANFPPPPIRCSTSSTAMATARSSPQEFNPRAKPGDNAGAGRRAAAEVAAAAGRRRRWTRRRPPDRRSANKPLALAMGARPTSAPFALSFRSAAAGA